MNQRVLSNLRANRPGGGGGGVSGGQLHDLTYSPLALFNFEENMLDSSGNGFDLQVGTGTERYGVIAGVPCFYFDNGTELIRPTFDAALYLLGAVSIEMILSPAQGIDGMIMGFGGVGDPAEAENIIYSLQYETTQRIDYFWESGSGVNREVQGPFCPAGPYHFAGVRDADGVTCTFYVNGKPVDSGVATNAPTGGTNGVLRVGDDGSNNYFAGYIASLKIVGRALLASEVVAEYNRTLGGIYGEIT